MAASVDVAAPRPRQRIQSHRCPGGCGIWQQSSVPRHAAPVAPALRRGHFVQPHGLSGDAAPAAVSPTRAGAPLHASEARDGRPHARARRGDRGGARALARIQWRNRPEARWWAADCVAIRVTPAVDCHHPRLAPEVWLLAERDIGDTPSTTFYFVNLPPTASLVQNHRLAHP